MEVLGLFHVEYIRSMRKSGDTLPISRAAKLPDLTKPTTVHEAAGKCSERALRGS